MQILAWCWQYWHWIIVQAKDIVLLYLLLTLSKCHLLIITLISLIFIINKIPLFKTLPFTTNVVITSVVITVSIFCFCLSLAYLVDLFHVSDKKHFIVYFLCLSVFCNLLWANILCIVASLIYFRFRNYINFDTEKLYITSLFNFDCNWHVYAVCIKLKYKISVNLAEKSYVMGKKV